MVSLWRWRLWLALQRIPFGKPSVNDHVLTLRLRDLPLAALVAASFLQGCAAIPKVELKAYANAYAETQVITNGVLDIVTPYERIVIRTAALPARVAPPAAPSPPPATCELPACDPSLLVNRPAAAQPRPVPVVAAPRCRNGFRGPDPFCYEFRDGYADIGDPVLVGAFRNLSNVVGRFNALLIAYADGASAKLIEQELSGLSATVTSISSLVPGSSVSSAFANRFNSLVSKIVAIAGPIIDREQLRIFLLDNYELVDQAIELMATSSPNLYSNVAVGTLFFRDIAPGSGPSLNARRREIRRLIANWTVLLDDNRRLLRELRIAIAAPDGLETRLRNLNESTVVARIDTSAIRKQIATLGTPVLPP